MREQDRGREAQTSPDGIASRLFIVVVLGHNWILGDESEQHPFICNTLPQALGMANGALLDPEVKPEDVIVYVARRLPTEVRTARTVEVTGIGTLDIRAGDL